MPHKSSLSCNGLCVCVCECVCARVRHTKIIKSFSARRRRVLPKQLKCFISDFLKSVCCASVYVCVCRDAASCHCCCPLLWTRFRPLCLPRQTRCRLLLLLLLHKVKDSRGQNVVFSFLFIFALFFLFFLLILFTCTFIFNELLFSFVSCSLPVGWMR